jgi:hypothetical protein
MSVSAVFLVIIVALVTYLTISKVDAAEKRAVVTE